MKKLIIILFFFGLSVSLFAQKPQYVYSPLWIYGSTKIKKDTLFFPDNTYQITAATGADSNVFATQYDLDSTAATLAPIADTSIWKTVSDYTTPKDATKFLRIDTSYYYKTTKSLEFYRNLKIGISAGASETNATTNCIYVGNLAGQNNTATDNTFIGGSSGNSVTTGARNTFIGGLSGFSNNGDWNTFVGAQAGASSSSSYSTYIGNRAGLYSSGASNVFIGSGCGQNNGTGGGNVFVGEAAGFSNTTGQVNVFIGNAAGNGNTVGNNNIRIGTFAAYHQPNNKNNLIVFNTLNRGSEAKDTLNTSVWIEQTDSSYNQKIKLNGNLFLKNKQINTPSDTMWITASVGIDEVLYTVIRVKGNGGVINITANPQIVKGYNGQVIEIWGEDDTNTVQLDDGNGLQLSGGASFVLGLGDVIRLRYFTDVALWRELNRSDN